MQPDIECVVQSADILGEVPLWCSRTKKLWWVDVRRPCLQSYDPVTRAHRAIRLPDGMATGSIALREAGGILLATSSGFYVYDPAKPEPPRALANPEKDKPDNRLNDGKCDRRGRFWGGTMDFACEARSGALYRYDPDGRCTRHEMGFAVTNGPTWSLDERTMYFNDTVRGRIHAFDFDAGTGALANQREWLRLARGDGLPDGMTTDAAGRLWLAHWGGACVSCHDPISGAELGRIALPTDHITNCAFGGPGLRTLFITSARSGLSAEQLAAQPQAGGLFAVELDEAGLPASMFGG